MISYQVTSAFIGLVIAGLIFWLIRLDRLHTQHAIWWLALAVTIPVLGFFPRLLDIIATKLNIGYPPTLLLTVGLGVILVKVLSIDIQQSRQELKIRRLTQRLALLEAERNDIAEPSAKVSNSE